jgi:transposase InsO family protein
MKKQSLLANIRRKNPYRQIQKATQEHNTAPNLVNREFQGNTSNGDISRNMVPYKILGTDITYLRLNNHWTYLSLLKDMITGEALGYKLSSHL